MRAIRLAATPFDLANHLLLSAFAALACLRLVLPNRISICQ